MNCERLVIPQHKIATSLFDYSTQLIKVIKIYEYDVMKNNLKLFNLYNSKHNLLFRKLHILTLMRYRHLAHFDRHSDEWKMVHGKGVTWLHVCFQ